MAFQLDDDGEFYDMDWKVKSYPIRMSLPLTHQYAAMAF